MTRLFAMAAISLAAATCAGFLLQSEAAVMAYDQPGAIGRTITWSQETGSYVGVANTRCLLPSRHDCHGVLFADAPAAADRASSRVAGLEFANGPALPIVNPYSGTFITFPLR